MGARRYFEDGEDTDYNDLVLEVNDTCPALPADAETALQPAKGVHANGIYR